MINLIVHPGLPKTGSSYLKKKVFTHVGYNLYPADTSKFETIHFKLFKTEYQQEENPFIKKKKPLSHYYLKNKYKNYLIDCFLKEEKNYVLSDSGFFGDIQLNRSAKNLYLFKEIIDEIVEEKKIEIKIKFVISIRSQFDFIRSVYNYTFGLFDDMSIESLMEKVCDNSDKSFYYFFEFENIIKSIKKIYNCEILLLPIEKLNDSPEEYIRDLENFLNIKIKIPSNDLNVKININYKVVENKKEYLIKRSSTSYLYFVLQKLHVSLKNYDFYNKNFRNNKLLKVVNDFFKRKKTKITPQTPMKNSLELKNKVFNTYSTSNKEMAKITGADLKKYNYY